jgi:hypothetical protein
MTTEEERFLQAGDCVIVPLPNCVKSAGGPGALWCVS